jgi:hypothetical protein
MKVKSLSAAVGVASVIMISGAQAGMYINELGTGETLLFPFYSAENGNNTLVNIANASTSHKAVKVRILEAQNSQEVLDYNLYLSPEDHFSFSISASAEGGAKMVTTDKSCTSPEIPADGEAFRTIKFDGDTNNGLSRTQVGYIEVIEMGQLNPNADPVIDEAGLADPAVTAINAAAAITHDANGVPAGCDIINKAWSSNGVWTAESKTTSLTGDSEFLANWAGGGLYGFATVINVPQGAAFGYDAIAIADHVAAGATGSDMHYLPGDIRPNFTDPAMDTAAIVSVNGKAVTLDFAGDYPSSAVERIQAMNALIMKTEVHNDYVTDPAIAATTDWLLNFPTKAFHVNGTEPIQPFSELWSGQSACEPTSLHSVDREESAPPPPPAPDETGPDFSPAPPIPPGPAPSNNDLPLCYEATIVQFASESAAETSQVAVGINAFLDADDGWATISFSPGVIDSTLGKCDIDGDSTTDVGATDPCTRTIDAGDGQLVGLPVVGFAVQKYVNGNAGGAGVLANYAIATNHKACRAGAGTVANEC